MTSRELPSPSDMSIYRRSITAVATGTVLLAALVALGIDAAFPGAAPQTGTGPRLVLGAIALWAAAHAGHDFNFAIQVRKDPWFADSAAALGLNSLFLGSISFAAACLFGWIALAGGFVQILELTDRL